MDSNETSTNYNQNNKGMFSADDVLSDGTNRSSINNISANDVLIDTLKDEIKFLRSELLSKDKIIELILKQLPSENESFERNVRENNEFKVSDKTFKGTKDSSLINSLPLHNKFTPLNHIKIKDDVMNVSADKKDTNKTESSRNTKSSKRTINIIGDSLLKDVKPYQLKHKVKKNDKLYVQSYRGARTSAMKHHANASLEFKSDIFILHCGTNDLTLEKTPETIATDILEIGLQLKSDNNDVYISGILTRRDDLNDKGRKVNDYLKLRCPNYALRYIDNTKVITNRHLNQSGLHLNKDGTQLLSENFLRVINT